MASMPRFVPNALSALRIALVPVWVWCAEAAESAERMGDDERVLQARLGAVATLAAIGLSDVLDGWVARTFGLQSRAGAVLDAVADKLTQVVLVTWLALRQPHAFASIPLWFLALLIARDAFLLVGWLALRKTADVEHRWHGKAASVLLFVALCAWTAGARVSPLWLVPVAALVVWSTVDYARAARRP